MNDEFTIPIIILSILLICVIFGYYAHKKNNNKILPVNITNV